MSASPQPGRRRVIKKVQGHGHHGGAWKIAYADFVTAMMALFLVLWLLASTDQKAREEIAQYFRTGILPNAELAMSGGAQYVPSIMERSPTPPRPESSLGDDAASVQASIDSLVENHAGLTELAGKVRVQATAEGVLIEIVDNDDELLFDSASSELNQPLQEFLEVLAPVLASRRQQIEIQGHTDARPFASRGKTNWDLSYERAAAARKIFERNGVKPERIVGVIGRAAAVPLVPDDPYAAKNRRLSVLLRAVPVRSAGVGDGPAAAKAEMAKGADWDSLLPPGAGPGSGSGTDAGTGSGAETDAGSGSGSGSAAVNGTTTGAAPTPAPTPTPTPAPTPAAAGADPDAVPAARLTIPSSRRRSN